MKNIDNYKKIVKFESACGGIRELDYKTALNKYGVVLKNRDYISVPLNNPHREVCSKIVELHKLECDISSPKLYRKYYYDETFLLPFSEGEELNWIAYIIYREKLGLEE